MPFGLTNASNTFQSYMNRVFGNKLRKFFLVFFDDILIYSKSRDEHMHHLDIVLTILADQSFCANLSKCEFGMIEILYIGHVIGQEGVKVHMEKIKAIVDWPSPRNLIELRGFIGI